MNIIPLLSKDKITDALQKVEQVVVASGNPSDLSYFRFHEKRFKKMAETIISISEPGCLVLDIGSHFLHSSLLLTFLGYRVQPMDVKELWDIPLIQQRAASHGLSGIIENNLEKLAASASSPDTYDVILFTEIFEHITFNPISFWQKIHTTIKNNGIIYITTPNSLTLYNIARTITNMARFRGIGLDTDSIFRHATYGHHWKEYSSYEIKKYFKDMNDGFQVELKKYFFKMYPTDTLKDRIRALLVRGGNRLPYFRDEIEAVIRVDKSKEWKLPTPGY